MPHNKYVHSSSYHTTTNFEPHSLNLSSSWPYLKQHTVYYTQDVCLTCITIARVYIIIMMYKLTEHMLIEDYQYILLTVSTAGLYRISCRMNIVGVPT